MFPFDIVQNCSKRLIWLQYWWLHSISRREPPKMNSKRPQRRGSRRDGSSHSQPVGLTGALNVWLARPAATQSVAHAHRTSEAEFRIAWNGQRWSRRTRARAPTLRQVRRAAIFIAEATRNLTCTISYEWLKLEVSQSRRRKESCFSLLNEDCACFCVDGYWLHVLIIENLLFSAFFENSIISAMTSAFNKPIVFCPVQYTYSTTDIKTTQISGMLL